MFHGSDVVRELRCLGVPNAKNSVGVPNAKNSVPDNPSLVA